MKIFAYINDRKLYHFVPNCYLLLWFLRRICYRICMRIVSQIYYTFFV